MKLPKKEAEAFCEMMERHGYFTSRLGDDGKRYYRRTSKWPPPDDFEPNEPETVKQ
jgi:hypothetical protein